MRLSQFSHLLNLFPLVFNQVLSQLLELMEVMSRIVFSASAHDASPERICIVAQEDMVNIFLWGIAKETLGVYIYALVVEVVV